MRPGAEQGRKLISESTVTKFKTDFQNPSSWTCQLKTSERGVLIKHFLNIVSLTICTTNY